MQQKMKSYLFSKLIIYSSLLILGISTKINTLVLNKTDIAEYSEKEKIFICEKVWKEIEELGRKPQRDVEFCFDVIDMVYKARRLMPAAEFDLTQNSMEEEKIENYANMDVYNGELKEITAEYENEINTLMMEDMNQKRNLVSKVPESYDLRSSDAKKNGGSCITYPDNQGKCANCYNYSALSAIEGAVCRQLGKLIPPLSQQHSLDCWLQNKGVKKACSGGQTFEVFNYALKTKVCTKESYPSTTFKNGKLGECNNNCKKCVGISNFKWNYTGSSVSYEDPWELIINAIYNYGPVTVSICSLMPGFSIYSGGFYEPPTCGSIWCGTRQVDHAVTLVGYGVSPQGKRYYILKNSWGLNWGNKGFMNISADMCSTFFNPGWVTLIKMENISQDCLDSSPNSTEIANNFLI
ncbi:Papain family cysteine protease [Cryptosporidium felis]|nr:Papain family cysteine protease [Cryptosporidium felis]